MPHLKGICFITCEICGIRTRRVSNNKRIFMAKFPLDADRCRQWVKYVGKEDLIYVPIEKLHTIKYVCGEHFNDKDFNKNKNRLKRSACPSKYLLADPLPDEMLLEFPYHIHSSHYSSLNMCNNKVPKPQVEAVVGPCNLDPPEVKRKKLAPLQDHSYIRDTDSPDSMVKVSSPDRTADHHKQPQTNSVRELQPSGSKPISDSPPVEDNLEDHTTAAAEDDLEDHTDLTDDAEPVQFSWQNTDQISLDEDEDSILGDGPSTMDMIVESKSTDGDADPSKIKNEKHTEYFCDSCSQEIIGFRYTCVQCENYDLCCACETLLVHPRHYMLRVPGQRPFSEVSSILEAVREKIKLLTEEAQKYSAGIDLEDEIKLEEPEFEEVTVDPFSDVTTPAVDHTSDLLTHTSDLHTHTSDTTSYTTHANDTGASSTHTSGPHSEQSKAPVKIIIPTDVLLKKLKVKNTSVPRTDPHAKNAAPTILKQTGRPVSLNMLNCVVELTRLSETYKQAIKVPGAVTHSNDKVGSKIIINTVSNNEMPKIKYPLHCVIPGCKSTSVTEKLYRFPWNKKFLIIWKTLLEKKFPDIKITLDKDGRCHQCVCSRHFEDKYLQKECFPIPTLFTEMEIATKTPELTISCDQMECHISRQKSAIVNLVSEGIEHLDDTTEDETESPGNQEPMSHEENTRENMTDTQYQEYLDEIWLDDTLLDLGGQQESSS